jgi:hypothetical protein
MLNIILLGVAAVLVITLFEIIEDRKRKEFIIKRMFDELNAVETKAQESVTLREAFEYEC